MQDQNLGTGDIKKLIRKFSIPCVISMVVAALYNIVDQIFIGWSSAGANGNAATNIVYPFTVFALGLALLIGDGIAANFSIAQGEGDSKRSDTTIGNGLILLVCTSIVLFIVGLLFKTNILKIFGANPKEAICYKYATQYFTIITLGIPFYMIGQGLNGLIRADGSPKFAMSCTLVGAITNLIGDPIFIFVFKLGVQGAAIATILGQILTFIMSVVYITRGNHFKLYKEAFVLKFNYIAHILSVGMASLIVQLSIVVIIAVNNNLITKYGYMTYASTGEAFGAVIPLAVVGIVMKVFGIVVSIVIGISLGGQPIIGYNMGAKNIDRIKETVQVITKLVLGVGIISFILFECAPDLIINLFGANNSVEYVEYARLCIRIFLGGIIMTCYIKSAAIILQSLGCSTKSTLLALMRDVIVFVPASIIIASLTQNIVSMLWSAIISDVISSIVGYLFVRSEIKKLERLYSKKES